MRRCQGLKIFCSLKKKKNKKTLFVGVFSMLILSVSHYLLHTVALWVCFVCCTVVKSPCRKINVLNSHIGILYWLMYIRHVIYLEM